MLRADDERCGKLDDAVRVAEGSGDDFALAGLKSAAGVALALRDAVADRHADLSYWAWCATCAAIAVHRG